MMRGQMHAIPGKKSVLALAILAVVASFLLSLSAFIADRYAVVAERLLDDPVTEEKDLLDISDQSIPVYNEALLALEIARIFAPLNSEYPRAQADLNARLGVWRETVIAMGSPLPGSLASNDRLHDAALQAAKEAVLSDPANADHYLALAQMYSATGDREAALASLMRAVESYPVNGSIRYAAAMQMLMMGLDQHAREQATLLAQNDDSYRLDDNDAKTVQIRELKTPWYEGRLLRSYLYKAMEMTWRTSDRDPKAVAAIVPDNADAREVVRIFFEQKGVGAAALP